MKKDISKYILVFILGGLFFGAFSVYATVSILSSQVDYIPRADDWTVTNVEGALDDLYEMAKNNGGNSQGFIGTNWQYGYTGSYQVFDTPATGEYKIELWGAQGGNYDTSLFGGAGGYTSGIISLAKGDLLYIYVGGQASASSSNTVGGWNGGGNTPSGKDKDGRAGSGATDIRLVPTSSASVWNEFDSLAAYENSASWRSDGGAAGGLESYRPASMGASAGNNFGTIANQVSGGKANNNQTNANAFGTFGKGGNGISTDGGSGGGAGYYGGGGSNVCSGGAGGSSFISGHQGCDAISEESTSASIIHTGQANHYSGIVFTNTVMIDGQGYQWTNTKGIYVGQPQPDNSVIAGHQGNGYAKITYMG